MKQAEARIVGGLAAVAFVVGGIGTARAVTFENRQTGNTSESAIGQTTKKSKSEPKPSTTIFSPSTLKKSNESPHKPDSKSIPPVIPPATKTPETRPTTTRPATTTTAPKTCENSADTSMSRTRLVAELGNMHALDNPYQTKGIDLRSDILDSSKTTGALISVMSGVTSYLKCINKEIDVKVINRGHYPGSQHSYGEAWDITPKNGSKSLSTWKITNDDPPIPPTPDQVITNPANSVANETANQIMNYVSQHPKVWDVIWMGSEFVIDDGKKISTPANRFWKDRRLRISHQDHIHISVNSESKPHAVTQNASSFTRNYSSESNYIKPKELQAA